MSTDNLPPWETKTELSRKIEVLRNDWRAGWSVPPRISLPDWADKYRVLPKGAGATSGPWETASFEVARGPMLSVTEPGVHKITAMVCTQLFKSELLLNIFGYLAHLDPCPILILQPKDDAAEQFSKERLMPTIKASPVLRKLVGGAAQTLTYMPFPGGFVALAGAGSPDNVARRPIRAYLADEIDKYRFTREGDTLLLAEERTAQFGLNWLAVHACSPTIEGESLIAASYADSDRRMASVACPHCSHRMFPSFSKHVSWDKRKGPDGRVIEHLTKTAAIYCEACEKEWSEGQRLRALQTIRWHQTKPFECCGHRQVPLELYDDAWRLSGASHDEALESVWSWWDDKREGRYAVYRATCATCSAFAIDNKHAGFQASKLFSPSPKDKPSDIAGKWISAQGDPDSLLVWWNTQMGLPHRPYSGKSIGVDALLSRCEVFSAEVPDGVAVITVGLDTQDYRVEMEVVGWGRDEESWSIDYHVIDGPMSDPKTHAMVDQYLQRRWKKADGSSVEVLAACFDSGGHHAQQVYAFCKARLGRRVWGIKGASERDGQRNPVWPTKKPSRRTKATYRPIMIGGNAARDTVRGRLLLEPPEFGVACPGYMHFPADRGPGYFEQLTADIITTKSVNGRKVRTWETPKGRANEASDCRVYAYAALCGLAHFGLQLNKRAMRPSVPKDHTYVAPIVVPQYVPEPNLAEIHIPNVENSRRTRLFAKLA